MGNNTRITYEVTQMLGHPKCGRCESCGERWPSVATWFYVLRTTTTNKRASVHAMYCCGFCGATFVAIQRQHEEGLQ